MSPGQRSPWALRPSLPGHLYQGKFMIALPQCGLTQVDFNAEYDCVEITQTDSCGAETRVFIPRQFLETFIQALQHTVSE